MQKPQIPCEDAIPRVDQPKTSSVDQSIVQAHATRRDSTAVVQDPSSVATPAPTRMWWERDANTSSPPTRSQTLASTSTSSASLLSSHPPPSIQTSFPDSNTVAPPTESPSIRSPAADFLNSFSSANSVISPPSGSYDNRSFSYSPPRSGNQRTPSSTVTPSGSWLGIGSAAAHLYDSSQPQIETRPDQEGARVGPSSRYLLGKTIGYGGFSIVREGWDQQEQGFETNESNGRKIAVKIVYHQHDQADNKQHQALQELAIWSTLPSHAHILPLLHHELISLDPTGSGPHKSTQADLLIMPYCDRGSLLDFVKSEGGPKEFSSLPHSRQTSDAWNMISPIKDTDQLSRSSSMKFNVSGHDGSLPTSSSRSGSGFVFPRNHPQRQQLARVTSTSGPHAPHLRTIHAGLSSDADAPASVSSTEASTGTLSRRLTSKTARSQGVPIDAARETMRQLTSALLTLHNKSHVLHGDLKLENVLGQGQTSWKKRQRCPTVSESGDSMADSMISVSTSMTQSGFVESDAVMPCWRIADFGLAHRVDCCENTAAVSHKECSCRHNNTSLPRSGHKSGRGGSLGYTAPEFLRARGTPGTPHRSSATTDRHPSPYAADMWALGCILYALLSGRLPFSDSFEPRLQMKIAKAEWEMPPRLQRRAQRLAAKTNAAAASVVPTNPTASTRHAQRSASSSLSGSIDATPVDRFAFMSQRRSVSVAPSTISAFGAMDLSASLPSLPPGHYANVHSDHVVGSAPGSSHPQYEVNTEAKALADGEADAESDEETDIDLARDGLSSDRAGARQVLRGLLEPEPTFRWTIEQLAKAAWMQQDSQQPTSEQEDGDRKLSTSPSRRRSSDVSRRKPWLSRGAPSNPSLHAAFTSELAPDSDGSSRRSRSTSRLSASRDRSGRKSNDVSGTSTPNRDRFDHGWLPHHSGLLGTSQTQWTLMGAAHRSDSPADSERRGRNPRSRMADLDENKTWTGDQDGSKASPSHLRAVPMAIPIRGSSQSRSRSRHSGDSSSPGAAVRRSMSHSRSSHSLPRDATLPSPAFTHVDISAVYAERAQARTSTARSRSRAPDALAHILGRGRSSSRPPSAARDGHTTPDQKATDGVPSQEQETRGRARDRKG